MGTKFKVFWHGFLIPFSNVCGMCFLNFSHIFASCYDVIFDAEHCVFLYFLILHFARSLERAKPNTSKIEPNMVKKTMQNRSQIDSKIDLILDPLWRCLATSILGRFWGRFGVHFGNILGSKIGLKAIGKIINKMIEKKSRAGNSRPRRNPGLWSLKRDQSDL